MTRLAAFLALMASPVAADSVQVWQGTYASAFKPSRVTLHAPTVPDAVATVTFQNEQVHPGHSAFQLEWEGIVVGFDLHRNVDGGPHERLIAQPPDGYIAVPWQITVDESATGVVQIIKWEGM